MIIDSHAHVFPDIIAEKAAKNIGKFYGIDMKYDGTVATLLQEGTDAGVDKFLIHSVATSASQIDSINSFIVRTVEKYPGKFIGFATLHPDSDNLKEQFEWAMEHGLKGVKLHPDCQKFHIDDEDAMPIYELCEGRCPVLIHMGDERTEYSKGERLYNVLQRFKNLDVIGAHFGGYSEWGPSAAFLSMSNIYVDTSSSMFKLTPHQVRELIDIYTPERVLFGTDYPMWNAADELDYLSKIDLTDEERELILHKNLERLLAKYEK